MQVSYKKLWKLLIDRDMTRTELRLLSGISSVSLAKLGKEKTRLSRKMFLPKSVLHLTAMLPI